MLTILWIIILFLIYKLYLRAFAKLLTTIIQISMSYHKNPWQGAPYINPSNKGDLDNKLSYQELLKLNKDLQKQIDWHLDTNQRLSEELNRLQNQLGEIQGFEANILEHDQGLYEAMKNEPTLYRYLPVLMPLMEAYDVKCRRFDETCEKLHEEFLIVERKYEDVLAENKRLKQEVQKRINEVIDFYNQKEPAEGKIFGSLVNDQLSKRHQLLAQQNNLLNSKFKELETRSKQLSEELKQKTSQQQNDSKKARQMQQNNELLSQEITNLKGRYGDLQIRNRQLENKQSQLAKAASRTDFQISQLNAEIEDLRKSVTRLRAQKQFKVGGDSKGGFEQGRRVEELQKQVNYLKAEIRATKSGSQVDTFMKDIEKLNRENSQFRQSQQDLQEEKRILNGQINELKTLIGRLESEINILRTKEGQLNKSLTDITDKNKRQASRQLKDYEDRLRRVELDHQNELEQRNSQIRSLKQHIERLKLQKENMERQVSMNPQDDSRNSNKGRQLSRLVQKLTDELKNTKQNHLMQITELETEIQEMRMRLIEIEEVKGSASNKDKEIIRMTKELEKYRIDIEGMLREKQEIIDQMKKVKLGYEAELKKKEAIFDGKIRDIRVLLEETLAKEKQSKEEVGEIGKKYKKTIEDIKTAYEDRITELKGHIELLKQKFNQAQTYKKVTRVKEEIV